MGKGELESAQGACAGPSRRQHGAQKGEKWKHPRGAVPSSTARTFGPFEKSRFSRRLLNLDSSMDSIEEKGS